MAVGDEAKEKRPDARPQAENAVDGGGSFAAVERPMSDRLRRATVATRFPTMREWEDSDNR